MPVELIRSYIASTVGPVIPGPTPSAGGSGMVAQSIGENQPTAPTSAFDTVTGSFLLAAVGRQFITHFATATVTDNASPSNSLALTGSYQVYGSLYPNSGVGIYTKSNITGKTGCIVTDSKPDDGNEITVMAVNLLNVTTIEASSFVYDTTGPTNTYTDITVTKPSVLVAIWAGDNASGEQGPSFSAGWTRQQFTSLTNGASIQMALATRVVSAAGTYGCVATPQTSQGALCFLYGLN